VESKWKISLDSINGEYKAAIKMDSLPSIYYNRASWISFSKRGEHTGNRYFFYKLDFDLPCKNLCGKSFDEDSSYCLNLDLYADNSIYEIYINGKSQSPNLGGKIPLANPFNPLGHTQSDETSVLLCKDWRAGGNSLIIQVASSATVAGLMVERNLSDRNNDTLIANICEGQSYLGYTKPGIYSYSYKAPDGCDSIRILKLTVQEKPQPVLGPDGGLCDGDSLILSPGLFANYQWQDGSTGNHYVVRHPGVYLVNVTNSCGKGSDEIIIKNGTCEVYFPTAFTPNGDGKNDSFGVLTDLFLPQYHLAIYNRWGQIVFETNNPLKSWDGKWNGKQQPSGIFVWYCSFRKLNLLTKMKGRISILN
jgi:gliding motility-associated-like protein